MALSPQLATRNSTSGSVHSESGIGASERLAPGLPAVELRALSRRYGRHWALINLNLDIPQGVVCLVAGHNGSGKSTLFRVLAGALRPHHGSVRVLGHDSQSDRSGLRQQIALLGHHSYTYDSLSARQNLSAFARLAGTFESHEQIEALLAEVGLAGRGDDAVETFSAGMRKRIAFARLLIQRPRVVLLDEPYGALDPAGFEFVDALIEKLKAQGITVLIASHLVEHVARRSDLALRLERGQLVGFGPAAELFEQKGGGNFRQTSRDLAPFNASFPAPRAPGSAARNSSTPAPPTPESSSPDSSAPDSSDFGASESSAFDPSAPAPSESSPDFPAPDSSERAEARAENDAPSDQPAGAPESGGRR